MRAIATIAVNTFREAVRHRILYLLFFFAVAIIAFSRILGELTVGDKAKIIMDMGLASISLSAVLIAIFLGVGLVSREIERRTIFVVLAKPVSRTAFIFGKALGLGLTVLIVTGLLGLELMAVVRFFTGQWPWHLLLSVALALGEALVILSFSLVFSSFTTSILASLYSLAFFVIGHFSWTFKILSDRAVLGGKHLFWYGAYLILPNLERFNIRSELVHGVPISLHYQVLIPILYGLCYSLGLLVLASMVFERKDIV
jgi:ABC-type transport system involved in multi-copper enzyme maturation permease subunit